MADMVRFGFIRLGVIAAAVLALAPGSTPLAAQNSSAGQGASFAGYLQVLGARARAEGVRETTIEAMASGLTFNPRVIALDQAQPGANPNISPPFWPYYRSHIDADRIRGGRAMMGAVAGIAPRIEAQYGVPVRIALAIWGNETNYGRYKGDFDLARSLATLAYEGRRRELFANEYIALLKMTDRGVPRSRLYGSWAGAFGNPQFLPSMYLRLARYSWKPTRCRRPISRSRRAR